jgi:rSAM/selenodomain-associated transferase 2
MISVVIPTRNAEQTLAATLGALVPAVVDGVVREVIIVDCGSADETRAIAEAAGARLVEAPRGRGHQMRAGGVAARHGWLLFLHADTVLEPGWQDEAARLIEQIESGARRPAAAAFRFALDDVGVSPRLIEWGVGLRCAALALPYGDQGLLISRQLYDEIGGFKAMALFEDVEIVRRIGRRRLTMLRARAKTSAMRYRQGGYLRRALRNWACFMLYRLGASPERLEKFYHG